MGKGMKAGKSKSREKHIILTQSEADEFTERTYWEILSMFLAAACDLHYMTSEDIVDYAARVNWYFDSVKKERLITLETVHEILAENMGIIFEKTEKLKAEAEAAAEAAIALEDDMAEGWTGEVTK